MLEEGKMKPGFEHGRLRVRYHPDREILVINGIHFSVEAILSLVEPKKGRLMRFELKDEIPEVLIVHEYRSPEEAYDYLRNVRDAD